MSWLLFSFRVCKQRGGPSIQGVACNLIPIRSGRTNGDMAFLIIVLSICSFGAAELCGFGDRR